MTEFVESLCRLYAEGRVTKTVIDSFLQSGKINREEYDYIIIALVPEEER
jgi:hypothetical protein